jgi:hypothetical protein
MRRMVVAYFNIQSQYSGEGMNNAMKPPGKEIEIIVSKRRQLVSCYLYKTFALIVNTTGGHCDYIDPSE